MTDRRPLTPAMVAERVFVSRQTAAAMLEISVDTFDTWVRDGFVPRAHVERGQIIRWHWPSLETTLATGRETKQRDPFMEALANVPKGRHRGAA